MNQEILYFLGILIILVKEDIVDYCLVNGGIHQNLHPNLSQKKLVFCGEAFKYFVNKARVLELCYQTIFQLLIFYECEGAFVPSVIGQIVGTVL